MNSLHLFLLVVLASMVFVSLMHWLLIKRLASRWSRWPVVVITLIIPLFFISVLGNKLLPKHLKYEGARATPEYWQDRIDQASDDLVRLELLAVAGHVMSVNHKLVPAYRFTKAGIAQEPIRCINESEAGRLLDANLRTIATKLFADETEYSSALMASLADQPVELALLSGMGTHANQSRWHVLEKAQHDLFNAGAHEEEAIILCRLEWAMTRSPYDVDGEHLMSRALELANQNSLYDPSELIVRMLEFLVRERRLEDAYAFSIRQLDDWRPVDPSVKDSYGEQPHPQLLQKAAWLALFTGNIDEARRLTDQSRSLLEATAGVEMTKINTLDNVREILPYMFELENLPTQEDFRLRIAHAWRSGDRSLAHQILKDYQAHEEQGAFGENGIYFSLDDQSELTGFANASQISHMGSELTRSIIEEL